MIYIIFNPNSGSKGIKYKNKILGQLKNIPNSELKITEYANHASLLAREALLSNAEKVIVVGGDGTVNEVASVLVNQSISLGIIPMGSGNGLARHLSIPLEFHRALDKSLNGEIISVDVAYFNEQPFFCTAGIGFDAVVAHQFALSKKRGLYNYIKSSLQSIVSYKSIEITDISNQPKELFSLTFANANQFGNNAFISPYSNLEDGLFEIVEIKPMNFIQLVELGIRLFLKNISNHNKVRIDCNNKFSLRAKIGTPMHIDGENLFTTQEQNKIMILPKSLKLSV